MVASRRKVRIHNPILNILLIFLVLVTFYPLLFTFLTSFKDNNQFFTAFWGLPNPVHLENYRDAFKAIMPYLKNSIIIAGISIFFILLTTSLSAYTLSLIHI